MPIQQISLGARPKGEGGDTWREGSEKINANFDDLDERTTLAQETANSKTANATDAHLLSRSNHTDTQPISTISGLQAALDSAASQINIAGNAATATKLATARAIGGVGFDGSANINLPGVNATGNQNTTGNAATATKLATARAIGGVGFDGSANINLPGVNATGNQNTTGNAATATKLATPRKINGVSFDGTGDINLDVYSKAETDALAEVPVATATIAGKAKIATTAIAQAGTNDTDFLTSKKLRDALNASGDAPIFSSRAWGCVNTKNGTIYAHGNIQSFSVTSTGVATVVFKTPMPHSNYAVLLGDAQNPAALARAVVKAVNSEGLPDNKTTSGFILATGTNVGYYGMDNVYFSVVC